MGGKKLIYLILVMGLNNQILGKTIEVFSKREFAKALNSFEYSLVHFYNSDSEDVKKAKESLYQASEFPQFIKADIGFLDVNLENNDLNQVYKNYDQAKNINIVVIFNKKSPYKIDGKIVKTKDIISERSIRKFVVINLQEKIDQIIDAKDPIVAARLRAQLSNPKIKAFLDTIAYCEGAFKPDGYRLKYMGEFFQSFHDHPRTVSCGVINGKTFCSSAAGRYQFLSKTWDSLVPLIGAKNFGPINQDIAALVLLQRAGAIEDLKKGNFEKAVKKVCHIWASLPGSPYGQEQKSMHMAHLKQIYKKRLAVLK